jgi:hypothetical protein
MKGWRGCPPLYFLSICWYIRPAALPARLRFGECGATCGAETGNRVAHRRSAGVASPDHLCAAAGAEVVAGVADGAAVPAAAGLVGGAGIFLPLTLRCFVVHSVPSRIIDMLKGIRRRLRFREALVKGPGAGNG